MSQDPETLDQTPELGREIAQEPAEGIETLQVVEPPPELAPEQQAAPVPAWEAEVDVLWQNLLVNVSARVETPIHNFLHDEVQALKARLAALFQKEA